jgi:hypothetical protein
MGRLDENLTELRKREDTECRMLLLKPRVVLKTTVLDIREVLLNLDEELKRKLIPNLELAVKERLADRVLIGLLERLTVEVL